jgi:hypothetical protein
MFWNLYVFDFLHIKYPIIGFAYDTLWQPQISIAYQTMMDLSLKFQISIAYQISIESQICVLEISLKLAVPWLID